MNKTVGLQSDALNKLNEARLKQKGPKSEAYFNFQRKLADAPDQSTQKAWFESMKLVMQELDETLRIVPYNSQMEFLDIGCCPGGFSSYILSKNRLATGMGISLPVQDGGHSYHLEQNLRPRLNLVWSNVTQYQLGKFVRNDPQLNFFPFSPASFDLVLLDGHPLRKHGKRYPHSQSDRLLMSQLIIGLHAIKAGGSVVMKLSKPESKITTQIMYLLDSISMELRTWKPICMHATRDTFYVVAKGVGLGLDPANFLYLISGLVELWDQLTFGDDGKGRQLEYRDLDFIVDDMGIKYYQLRWKQLTDHILQAQVACLQGWHAAMAKGF